MAEEKKSWTGYFTKKVLAIIGALVSVFGLVAAIWGFEAHYATNNRVDKVVISASSEVQELETRIAGALERQQYKSDARYWQIEYDRIMTELNNLRRQMGRYPNDDTLKQDYQDLLERRKIVKDKIDQSFEKIKVN